ncbi:MAG: putative CRISPR-associated protein [Bacteroidales bacterium]|nr:putative CRISPR-associated protein [Bacteroidales bacterium]
MKRTILLCTVGTSLFEPNLRFLRDNMAKDGSKPEEKRTIPSHLTAEGEALAVAYEQRDWSKVASALGHLPSTLRTCGAEINSVASLIAHDYAPADCGVYFFHSDTHDGRAIAEVLAKLFAARGHAPSTAVPVPDLQDIDPKRFRTKGLRNLAKLLCQKVRDHGANACAINATGGYKAQIAVAVLLGQALNVPVYYKHERFEEIIPFPPMPVSLDFEVWMRLSGMLAVLQRETDLVRKDLFDQEEWDEKAESLVNGTDIDGVEYIELSATGEIFHDTFRERFRSHRDRVLPPPALAKKSPHFEDAGWPGDFPKAARFIQRVTDEVAFVTRCATHYYNPDLPEPIRFREARGGVEGVFSDGSRTVKFRVETTSTTDGQRAAAVAALNEWLANQ